MHRLAGLVAAISLAGCAAIPGARPPMDSGAVEQPEPLPADTALAATLSAGPPIETMPFADWDAGPALERLRDVRPCAVEREAQRAWAAVPMQERTGRAL